MKNKFQGMMRTRTRIFVLCFSSIFAFCAVLLGLYCHSVFIKEEEERLHSYQAGFEQSVNSMQEELDKVQQFSSQLSETGWFKELLYKRAYGERISEEAYELSQYNKELTTYTVLNPFMDMALLHFPGREYTLSSLALFYGEGIPEVIFSVEDIPGKTWEEVKNARNVSRFIPNVSVKRHKKPDQGMLYLNSYPFHAQNIRANLIVYISYGQMEKLIVPELLENGSFQIVRAQEVLWSSKEMHRPEGLTPEARRVKIGRDWWFCRKKGITEYYLSVPERVILGTGRPYLHYGMYYLLLFFVCLAVSAYLTKRIYHPLKHILESELIPRSYDETLNEYYWLEREIGSLVSKEAVLRKKIEEQKPVLMNAVLGAILYENRREEEFEKLMALLGISFPYGSYQILTARYEGRVPYDEFDKLFHRVPRTACAVYYVFIEELLAVLVNADSQESFAKERGALFTFFKEDCPVTVHSMGAGDTVRSVGEIQGSFCQARERGDYVYFQRKQTDFFDGAITRNRRNDFTISEDAWHEVLYQVKEGNPDAAGTKLEEFLCEEKLESTLTPDAARRLMGDLCRRVAETRRELSVKPGEEETDFHLRNRSLQEDTEILLRYIRRVCRTVENRYEEKNQEQLGRIMQFVEENLYNPELSLQMVAERFGYSSAYTSRIFKEYYHQNFLGYVTSGRIRKAKKLLEETELSINEIAGQTGFGNDITFRRVFKKETNMIPSNYRSLYGKK